jgi:transposase-like protein
MAQIRGCDLRRDWVSSSFLRHYDETQSLQIKMVSQAPRGSCGEGHPPGDPSALLARRNSSAEDKIRIVLDGLRGEDSLAELCRKEGIAQSLCYTWSKEFMEAGKRRLAGDTARAATTDEVRDLRREASALKECVANL